MSRRNSTASSSSSVVGFADQPYDHPAGNVAEQPRPSAEIPAPIFNHDPPVPHPEPPVDVPDPAPPIKLTGWRSDVSGLLCVCAFVVPWVISLALSWVAHERVPFGEAPKEIKIAAAFSTTEVASLFLFFVWAVIEASWNRNGTSAPSVDNGCGFLLWINFLLWAPMGTGIYIWSATANYPSCEPGSRVVKCRIGKGIVTAIGVYRTFGVLFIMCAILMLENWLTKSWKRKQQERVAAQLAV